MADILVAKIAVSAATYWLDKPYDYLVPEELAERAAPGVRVIVPFSRGNKRAEGIILALAKGSKLEKLKPVEALLDETPYLSPEQIQLALWMRGRFFCTVYSACRSILPSGLWFNVSSVVKLGGNMDKEAAYEAAGRSKSEKLILDVLFAHKGMCELRDIEIAFGDANPSAAISKLRKKGVITYDSKIKRRSADKTMEFASLAVSTEEAELFARQRKRRAPAQAAILELLCSTGTAAVTEIAYFTGASRVSIRKLVEEELVTIESREVFRRPEIVFSEEEIPELNADQLRAFEGLWALTGTGKPECALIFGVTGSGKTLVYIHLIRKMLEDGKASILLVPEIALTPQMVRTFSAYFGDNVAVLHSSLTMGERYDEWKRVREKKARVVIGTRSAVFAPVSDLGLVIIDEEQEYTYKSEMDPRYHAREVAKYICAKSGALLLLGSATPDIESMYFAQTGKYSFFSLPNRYNERMLPLVSIVDMKKELRSGNGSSISSVLREELKKNIDAGEQSILFLNRRGTSRLITCVECGFTFNCIRCSVSLTYHSAKKRLICHYCGHTERRFEECPECGGRLSFVGAGTQKVQEELEAIFPRVPVLRMDTDTVAPTGSHDALLQRFIDRKIPIMVGTQMVTKGLNFENVTLVGVISADNLLYTGDYRSGERAFALITQVVGRAGRGEREGRAVIQTFTPQNQVIRLAALQDYEGFYNGEIELRRMAGQPPFSSYFSLTVSGLEEDRVIACAIEMRAQLLGTLRHRTDATVLGPAPLSVLKVNNRFRYRMTVTGLGDNELRNIISHIVMMFNTDKRFRAISVFADSNPSE